MEGVAIRDGVAEMDFEKVTRMLSNAYWSLGIKLEEVKKGAENSALVVGAFLRDQTQIGYLRVISDRTRFAYILDVYVEEQYRRRGVAQKMLRYTLNHDLLRDVYQWLLTTRDAHRVYGKAGFNPLSNPQNWMEIRHERPKR